MAFRIDIWPDLTINIGLQVFIPRLPVLGASENGFRVGRRHANASDWGMNGSKNRSENGSNCGGKWMIIDNVITGLYGHFGLIIVK